MAKKPGLRIDVRVDVLMDERYEALADIAGYNRHEALGRMFALWAWCLDKQEFVLHEAVIRRFLGPRGVEAILGEGVDSLALGERRDGGVYVRGTENLLWLGARREAAAKGGEARSHGVRSESGCFVSGDTNTPAKRHPASSQATSQTPPNVQPSGSGSGSGSDPVSDPEDLDQPRSGEHGETAPAPPSRPPGKPRKGPGKRPQSGLQDGWVPARSQANLEAESRVKAVGVDLRQELLDLRNWALKGDERCVDWDARWRLWISRAAKDTRKRGYQTNSHPTQVALDVLQEIQDYGQEIQ